MPIETNRHLANHGLTFLVKEATNVELNKLLILPLYVRYGLWIVSMFMMTTGWPVFELNKNAPYLALISRVFCQNSPTRHAYAWQVGPFWQGTLDMEAMECILWAL